MKWRFLAYHMPRRLWTSFDGSRRNPRADGPGHARRTNSVQRPHSFRPAGYHKLPGKKIVFISTYGRRSFRPVRSYPLSFSFTAGEKGVGKTKSARLPPPFATWGFGGQRQLSIGTIRILCPSGADRGVGAPFFRQLRSTGPTASFALGARQYLAFWR